MIRRTPTLSFPTFLQALHKKAPVVAPDFSFLYGYARQALEDGFRLLNLQPGDTVLYPDYICDVTLAPCHALNLTPRYYPVTDSLDPDWEVLDRLLTDGAKAVLSVNYFGFPQNQIQWRALVDRHKTYWIEDNAHGFGCSYHGQKLGSFGDLGLCSMRKSLPLFSGAKLEVNNPDLRRIFSNTIFPLTPLKESYSPEFLRRFIRHILEWLCMDSLLGLLAKKTSYDKIEIASEHDRQPKEMDPLSRRLLTLLTGDLDTIGIKRRLVYETWHKFCQNSGLQPVYKILPAGVVPLVYPCYAKNFEERQAWLSWGKKNRIDIHPWPSLPLAHRTPGGPCMQRWRRLLCFPVQQQINPSLITGLRHP